MERVGYQGSEDKEVAGLSDASYSAEQHTPDEVSTEGMPTPDDGAEAKSTPSEKAAHKEKNADNTPLDAKEKRFVLLNIQKLREGVYGQANTALSQMEGVYSDFRQRSWDLRCMKWMQEKFGHLMLTAQALAEGGVFASLTTWLLGKYFKGKDKVNDEVEQRRKAQVGIAAHMFIMHRVMDNINKEFVAAESATSRGELESSVVKIQMLSRTLSEGLDDIQRFKSEIRDDTSNVADRLDVVIGHYDIKTSELQRELSATVGRIREVMTYSGQSERAKEIKEQLLNGVARVEDYKEFLDPLDYACFRFREIALAFNTKSDMENIKNINNIVMDPALPIDSESRRQLFEATEEALHVHDEYDTQTGHPIPMDEKVQKIKFLLIATMDQVRVFLTEPREVRAQEELAEAA